MADLHSEIAHLRFLVGSWVGNGRGDYPTIDGFSYTEEATYAAVPGKPFLFYSQRTRGEDGDPLHAEVGYVRPVGVDRIELVLAHPTGITEIQAGELTGQRLDLRTTNVGLSPTAKDVRSLSRTISVTGDEMRYLIEMAAVGQPLQFHLEATLHRQG